MRPGNWDILSDGMREAWLLRQRLASQAVNEDEAQDLMARIDELERPFIENGRQS